MSIQTRLRLLERHIAAEQQGIPIKPMDWTDKEYTAVVEDLGLTGKPILALCDDEYLHENKSKIDQIRLKITGCLDQNIT